MPEQELTSSSTVVPDLGQLVRVRQRQWIVSDIDRSDIQADPLHPTVQSAQHLIKLASVEDDGLGEELQVIWEIEPGTRTYERMSLPTPHEFDDPARLDAFINAVRWGAIQSADGGQLQSPFRAGISIVDYQLDPVVRALQMPRVNLLIADDVGLGKTIEAGLVAQELILRQRVRSILVVVPSSLQIKWRDEMQEKFGLEFRIVDSDLMRDLRRRRGIHANPWTHFPRLITSIDYLKRDRPMRLFRSCLPAPGETPWPRQFDLMIVDEAHNVAPASGGKYATDSDRTLAIRTLSPHFEHKLFLTATPHNGYQESFTALLELLDDQRFAVGVPPDEAQRKAVMVHRLKSEIVNADGTKKFPERRIEAIEVPYTDAEREAYAKLVEYGGLRTKTKKSDNGKIAADFVVTLLKKRMFSSPAAFGRTLEKHRQTLAGVGKETKPRKRPAPGILRRQLNSIDEDYAVDEVYEERTDEVIELATEQLDGVSAREVKILDDLARWTDESTGRPDSKANTFLEWLEKTVRPDGKWNDERVIIFTEWSATQKWLKGMLAGRGMAADGRLETMYGGMDTDDRERIKAAFQTDPRRADVRILLATDSASEGIDLQRWCHRVVHYEIPWNPMRLEQRNGRVDRHGQRADEVLIYHFVGKGWQEASAAGQEKGSLEGDLEFLSKAAKKVEAIRRDLGKVGPVIARQIEEAMLGKRTALNTERAETEANEIHKQYAFERDLARRIRELGERLDTSRKDLHVSPENVRSVVAIGLELAHRPPLRDAELEGVWPDPTGKRAQCPVFRMPALDGSWAKCRIGLLHPHTQEERPITFDQEVAAERDDVVLVHLQHPLVRLCQGILRSEVWATGEQKNLERVTACLVEDGSLDDPAVVAHARLVVIGGDGQRLHEQIITAGGTLRDGRFARLNVSETEAALTAATLEEPSNAVKSKLIDAWASVDDRLLRSLEVRMTDRTKNLEQRFKSLAETEAEKLGAIIDELELSIRDQLTAEPPEQLELYSTAEQEQLERNRDSLHRRLEALPGERERETAEIRRRYANPEPQLFPVAVTFLVPPSWKG